MGSKWRKSPPELIAFFEAVMRGFPRIEKRKMFGYPCRFLNGNLFTGLHQEDWLIRLGEGDRNAIIEKYDTKQFEPMAGRVMREYVLLPEEILEDEDLLQHWIERSYSFAGSLPPKLKARPS